MAKRILTAIQRWRYLGYDRDTVRQFRAESNRANLHTVKRICLITAGLLLIFAMFCTAANKSANHLIFIAMGFAILTIFYVSATRWLSRISTGPIYGTAVIVYATSIVLYVIGIYFGTFLSGDELGVLSVWMFLLVQISFDTPPVQNVLTVIPMAVLFLLLSYRMKTLQHWHTDMIYTFISVSVGVFVSYHQSHLALDNIIAKSNLQRANFTLYHTATTDELTGLMNRRMVFDRYETILDECERDNKSVACIVLDIDDYKQFNDSYGHPEGDVLLRRIGETLRVYSVQNDIEIGRIGGEEFLAVWPEESVERCEQVAETLRASIEQMAIPHSGALDHAQVTISVGLCLLPSSLARNAYYYADKALYRAKEAGKNCSCRFNFLDSAYIYICRKNAKEVN